MTKNVRKETKKDRRENAPCVASEQRFSAEELDRHFRNVPDAFFLMKILSDDDGNPYDWTYVYANDAATANTGISRERFIGRSFSEMFVSSGENKWLKPYCEAAFGGISRVFEDYSREIHRFVQVTCFQYEYGYAACFVRDVTKDHLYEKTIRSTMLSYREIYYVDITENFYRMIYPDFDCAEERGNYTQAIENHFNVGKIAAEDKEKVKEFLGLDNIKKVLAEKDYAECKYCRLGPDGREEWCITGFTVGTRDENGEPLRAIMGIRSVDALVREELARQEELQKAVEEAERANRAKSDFLSSMSHDMRTPLNIVIGMATLARLRQDDPAQVLDCMDKIETAGKHLLTLINQVLDMAKIESGELALSEGAFTIPALMEQVTQMAHGMIADRRHVLNFVVRAFEHENVIGDENRLEQVLLNLLSNASKYSDQGKKIIVEMEELPYDRSGYGLFRFAVTDEGRGMSETFLQRLFEPFTREEDSRLSKVQGTGLGMPIAKRIVQKMGGRIFVESEAGKGSRFTVEIPLKLQPEQPESQSFPDEYVLVVDDYADCIASICSVLESLRIARACAHSGGEALRLLEEADAAGRRFTCVLADYRMPDMDGLEVAHAVKAKYGAAIRVGLVSAYDYASVRYAAENADVDFYCPKPIFRSVLLEVFRSFGRDNPKKKVSVSAARTRSSLCALIAEDNIINAMIEARLLEHFGVRSVIAENGEEAVERFSSSEPGTFDCVFMDVQMPVMNGLDAARAIRRLDRPDKDLPIFAMTANVFTDDVESTREAGMQEHIGKPIELDRLRAVLRKWFPERAAHMES